MSGNKNKKIAFGAQTIRTSACYSRLHSPPRCGAKTKEKMKHLFKNTGQTFSAKWAAEAWLRNNGYSFGSTTCRSDKVAIQKGEYTLPQKVHNFGRADFALADGWMTSCDYREGDVVVEVKEN